MKTIAVLAALLALFCAGIHSENVPVNLDDLTNGADIESFVRSKIGTIKDIMKNGDPENDIPKMDPYVQDDKVPNSYNVSTSFANARVEINDAVVTGLSKFQLTSLEVSQKDMTMAFSLKVPNLYIKGNYKVDGTFQLIGPVDMDGSGPFTANLIAPKADIMFKISNENGTGLSVMGTSVNIDYEDVDFNLEGFMPGKPIGKVILQAIKARSKEYFEESKEDLEEKLSEFMALSINSIFDLIVNDEQEEEPQEADETHVINKRSSCGSGNMNSYIDQVLTNARPLIRSKADPLRLKDLKKVVKLYDGKVLGLSSIRRTGNVVLSCTSSHLSLLANLGFGRISAGYRWKRRIVFVKLKGRAEIRFKSLSVSAKISQQRKAGAHPVITSLDLKLKGIRVHLSGLSLAGHILAAILSLLSNIFRKAVANAIEKPIKKALQKELSKITLPF